MTNGNPAEHVILNSVKNPRIVVSSTNTGFLRVAQDDSLFWPSGAKGAERFRHPAILTPISFAERQILKVNVSPTREG